MFGFCSVKFWRPSCTIPAFGRPCDASHHIYVLNHAVYISLYYTVAFITMRGVFSMTVSLGKINDYNPARGSCTCKYEIVPVLEIDSALGTFSQACSLSRTLDDPEILYTIGVWSALCSSRRDLTIFLMVCEIFVI